MAAGPAATARGRSNVLRRDGDGRAHLGWISHAWRRCGRNHHTNGNVANTTEATIIIMICTLSKSLINPYSTGDNAPAPTPPV
jgi:hypothetical protein